MECTSMLTILNKLSSLDILTIYWTNNVIIKGTIDTFSETTNCLDDDDPSFKEYFMCVIQITDIVKLPYNSLFNEKIGDLIELSEINEPLKIELSDGRVIWEKGQ